MWVHGLVGQPKTTGTQHFGCTHSLALCWRGIGEPSGQAQTGTLRPQPCRLEMPVFEMNFDTHPIVCRLMLLDQPFEFAM